MHRFFLRLLLPLMCLYFSVWGGVGAVLHMQLFKHDFVCQSLAVGLDMDHGRSPALVCALVTHVVRLFSGNDCTDWAKIFRRGFPTATIGSFW